MSLINSLVINVFVFNQAAKQRRFTLSFKANKDEIYFTTLRYLND